jgi:hypothetical protein
MTQITRGAPTGALDHAPSRVTTGTRDVRLDVLRGIFIVSMAFGHLAMGTTLADATHPFNWVDGAFGFVFLSGLVLSLTRRKQILRGSIGAAHGWIARRTVVLWVISSALIVVALAMKGWRHSPTFMWPPIGNASDVVHLVPGVLALETQPEYLEILPMYVVFLLLAQPALWGLRARGPLPVVAASLAVYVPAQLGLLDHVPGRAPAFPWPAWQLLFIGGMAVGWCWPAVDAWYGHHRRAATLAATPVVLALLLAARGRLPWLANSFNKADMSPMTVIAGLCVLICLLAAVATLLKTPARGALSAIAIVGRHSRSCFITLTVVHVLWLTMGQPSSLAESMRLPVAAAGLVACWTVAVVTEHRTTAPPWWRRAGATLEPAG